MEKWFTWGWRPGKAWPSSGAEQWQGTETLMEKKGRGESGTGAGQLGETVGKDGWISGPPPAFGQPVAMAALSSWLLKGFGGSAICQGKNFLL